MRRCVPQRQRLAASACLISSSLGFVLRGEQRGRLHDHAVDAVAALRRLLVDEGRLHRVRLSAVPSPSSVTTFCAGLSEEAGVTQERTALPSMCTVQAPHWPSPQPKRGPCRPRSLRRT